MGIGADRQALIVAISREYLDVPWRPHGRSREGVDCVGLAVCVYREAGFEIDEGRPDYRGLDWRRMVGVLNRYFTSVPIAGPLEPGDVVVYGLPREGHLGLILDGDPQMAVHCPMFGKVVESRFDRRRGKIRGVYRWRF